MKECWFAFLSGRKCPGEGQDQGGVGWIAGGDVGKLGSTREMHSASGFYAAET